MANYSTNEFKNGLKLMIDGDPCSIIENEFVKPGKGQAFSRVKIRNLKSGKVLERTYKSGESVEAADVIEVDLQYLYRDDDAWHFMDEQSFEQYMADANTLGDTVNWLREQDICIITLWNNIPISVTLRNFVNLLITETGPGVRGDTAGGANKPATVETGAIVRVPLFVDQGDVIKIDTRTGEYVSRVRD